MGVLDTSVQVGTPQTVVSANVSASTTWTSDHEYILNGLIYVDNGATLTIQPGTVVRGMADSETAGDNNPGTLIVTRGAKLIANGTATDPIIFTDMDDDNVPGGLHSNAQYNNNPNSLISERWGGLVLLGNTYIAKNQSSTGLPVLVTQQIEGVVGDSATFGGTNDDDNSGSLSYLSIRYGGAVLMPSKEINGLTMGAVGRGTVIHHIEVMNNVDDAFEWFGGTVNSKYLVGWNCGDDGFDADMGYRGKVQFGLVVKGVCKSGATNESGLSNCAMELDGPESPTDGKPFGLSQWRNLTLIGHGSSSNNANDKGIVIRDNSRPQIYHSIVMDMQTLGVSVEDAAGTTIDSFAAWSIAWNGATAGDFDGDGVTTSDAALYGGANGAQHQGFQTEVADCLFSNITGAIDATSVGVMTGKQNSVPASSPIRGLTRLAAGGTGYTTSPVATLDPRAATTAQGINKSLDAEGFFDVVNYRGAFGPADTWANGWTLISSMGVLDSSAPAAVTETLHPVTGWNWISFHAIPADNSLEAVMASYGPQDSDEMKSQTESATYFGGTWYGLEGGIQPGVTYVLKVQNPAPTPLVVTGAAPAIGTAIPLVNGWNWVSFTGQNPTAVNTAMGLWSPGNATDSDELKSQTQSATFFGGTWYDVGFNLQPGLGYKLKVQKAGPAALLFQE